MILKIENDRGIPFLVRVLMPGDKYGLDDCLAWCVNDYWINPDPKVPSPPPPSEPGIEFFDARYPHWKVEGDVKGQFVSRYYLSSLAEHSNLGICLDGANRDAWYITGENMTEVIRFAKEEIHRRILSRLISEENIAIEFAKEHVESDDRIAVDDGAKVEKVDGGYWVEARVWVSNDEHRGHVEWKDRLVEP